MVFLIFLSILQYIHILSLESETPLAIDPQGASRSSGGLFRGHALGNAYNLADMEHLALDEESLPLQGQVYYYISGANPSTLTDITKMQPSGTFQHTKVSTVAPVLVRLGRLFPPLKANQGKLKYFVVF